MNAADISNVLKQYGSSDRPIVFMNIVDGLDDEDPIDNLTAWNALRDAWPSFDKIDHQDFEENFFGRFLIQPAEFVANIADETTIYRGQDADNIGLSWTTDEDVAEGFAIGHRGAKHRSPMVLSMEVSRHHVAFTCDDRNECEVVLMNIPSGWMYTACHLISLTA